MRPNVFLGIDGVVLASHDPHHPPPYIGIVAGVHGNETCGLEVLKGLTAPSHPLRERLCSGTLVLIHGNPVASEQGLRFSRGGTDLNRLFDYRFVDQLSPEEWSYEHRRAMTLKPVLESLDAVLDIHSCSARSSPFVITNESLLKMASRLGLPYVTYGWNRAGFLMDRVLITPVLKCHRPAFSIECGQHQDPRSIAVAWTAVETFLNLMEVIRDFTLAAAPDPTQVEVLYCIVKPSQNFVFSRPFEGMDFLPAGNTLGSGDGVSLVVTRNVTLLLPNQHAGVGEDMVYLGRALPEMGS